MTIEPRPASTWGITLANLLPKEEWNEIRQQVYWEADYTCVICGSTKQPMHAHEQWLLDDKKKVQRLVGIECCCRLCHDVHHFGRSSMVYRKTYREELVKHWCKVNSKSQEDFNRYYAEVQTLSRKRANIYYIVKVGKFHLKG